MLAIRSTALAVAVLVLNAPLDAATASEPTNWVRQFGTAGLDEAKGAAVDAGGASYVVGETFGTLPGQTPAGTLDAFIRKYDPFGAERRTRQFGTAWGDNARDVTVGETNRLLVAVSTEGALPGQVSGDGFDAFVASFDTDGRTLWIRQFGSTGDDFGGWSGRASPGGRTAFLGQYGPTGVALWTNQFDTGAGDDVWDVTVASDGIAQLVGTTRGVLPGRRAAGRIDAFVRQYGPGGSETWTRQYGSSEDDYALAAAADQDRGLVVAGSTRGTLDDRAHGNLDAYVLRLPGPRNQ